jgi:amino acid transporter
MGINIIISVLVWYLIGFISVVYALTEDDDIKTRDMFDVLVMSLAGVIALFIVLASTIKENWKFKNKVIFKKRN